MLTSSSISETLFASNQSEHEGDCCRIEELVPIDQALVALGSNRGQVINLIERLDSNPKANNQRLVSTQLCTLRTSWQLEPNLKLAILYNIVMSRYLGEVLQDVQQMLIRYGKSHGLYVRSTIFLNGIPNCGSGALDGEFILSVSPMLLSTYRELN